MFNFLDLILLGFLIFDLWSLPDQIRTGSKWLVLFTLFFIVGITLLFILEIGSYFYLVNQGIPIKFFVPTLGGK